MSAVQAYFAVEAYFARINTDAFDDLADVFAEDAEVHVPGNRPVRGRAAISDLYRRIFAPWEVHNDEPVRVVRAGRTVTVEVRFTGELAGGERFAFDGLDVIDLDENGLITRLTNWYDSHALREKMAEAREPLTPARFEGLRSRLNRLGTCTALGIECITLSSGSARVALQGNDATRHPNGSIPGAFVAALADVAASFALHTVVGPGFRHATVDLTTHFVRPAIATPLVAAAVVDRRGQNLAFASARISDADGDLCALASGTWAITSTSPAKAAPSSFPDV